MTDSPRSRLLQDLEALRGYLDRELGETLDDESIANIPVLQDVVQPGQPQPADLPSESAFRLDDDEEPEDWPLDPAQGRPELDEWERELSALADSLGPEHAPAAAPAEPVPATLTTTPKALGENPFLPRSVLDRLRASHATQHSAAAPSLMAPPLATRAPEAATPRALSGLSPDSQLLLETNMLMQEVIDEFLPRIAQELRRRLQHDKRELLERIISERMHSRREL